MLSSFSLCTKRVMSIAESIAYDLGHINVGSEHLLLALLKDKESFTYNFFNEYGITYSKVKEKVLKINPKKNIKPVYMEYSSHLKSIIDEALEESKRNNEDRIEIERLTKAMLSDIDSFAVQIIMGMDKDVQTIKEELEDNMVYEQKIEDLENLNLKVAKKHNKLIGREKELQKIQEILLKKNKRNVILLGDPGVGKTAIVEELAKRINEKKVLKELENKTIYQLNISDIVAGSKYRGEFEEKLKKIIKKIKNKNDTILFIDEIHSVVGAGGAEGAIDASNILKPYLSSGEINCIGATTFDEYYKTIEKEKAFQRRFQTINISEATEKETIEILIKTKESFEKFHNIKIEDKAIKEIVQFSFIHILNRKLPDKAIDLLDVLCVKAKSENKEVLDKELTLLYLNEELERIIEKENIETLKEKLDKITDNKTSEEIVKSLSSIKKRESKPLLSLCFLGKEEDVKNDIAKTIAKTLFDDCGFLKLNMEDYFDYVSYSKLLGAAPGYVGYEQNHAFEQVIKHPYSLVLFSCYDKANEKIKDVINKILEEGILIDNSQRRIDFRNSILIFTITSKEKEKIGFVKTNLKNKNSLKVDNTITI